MIHIRVAIFIYGIVFTFTGALMTPVAPPDKTLWAFWIMVIGIIMATIAFCWAEFKGEKKHVEKDSH